ncbi:glycosyl transferase family 1 [Pandoraea terrae]|uniref:Glycosyl transferase family 1 n=1 Tax=Pandoraea terrae TaxID=1537710 RepID=A0A5E4UU12_9BURK|nr:glycosyltransferase [Pandoraea terrae]VVE02405.1 glycosyl transferase family 1 [Pandoraea terrae]
MSVPKNDQRGPVTPTDDHCLQPVCEPAQRILHVLPTLARAAGGVAEAVVQLVNHMRPLGCVSEVVCLDAPAASAVTHIDGIVHRLGRGLGFYGLCPKLVRWIRAHAHRFDAVIVHGIWQFHSVAAWLGVLGSATPLYVFPHGMLDPWFQRTYPRKHLKKRVYWALAEAFVFRRAKAVLFTCAGECELARRPFLANSGSLLTVTGFGIGGVPQQWVASSDVFLRAFPALRGKRVVLFLGRLHEKKGCDLLLKAFAEATVLDCDIRLVMAGPGAEAERASLERLAHDLDIADRIVWTGMLEGAIKWGALQAAEVFVLPSHQENFGIAVVEALASGTPVIISEQVNIWREIVRAGAGRICADTEAGVTEALMDWVGDTTAQRRQAMRAAARACFEQSFRIEDAAARLSALLATASSHDGGVGQARHDTVMSEAGPC